MRLIVILKAALADERGAAAIEYGLILAMIFLAMIGAVSALGNEFTNMFNDVSSKSVSAMGGAV